MRIPTVGGKYPAVGGKYPPAASTCVERRSWREAAGEKAREKQERSRREDGKDDAGFATWGLRSFGLAARRISKRKSVPVDELQRQKQAESRRRRERSKEMKYGGLTTRTRGRHLSAPAAAPVWHGILVLKSVEEI